MNIVEKIKNLLQEAELYHTQGLLNESRASYDKAIQMVNSNEQLKKNKKLMDGIIRKKGALEKDIVKVETADQSPEVSAKVQDLIKKMFAFSAEEDEDKKALDGAIALAKFGQYQRALQEFNELIKKDSLRIVAAKNIVRCRMEISGSDDIIAQFEEWRSSGDFVPAQLEKLRIFINAILQKEGVDKTIAKEEEPAAASAPESAGPVIQGLDIAEEAAEDDEIIDINSIGVTLPSGPKQGQMVELHVSFQHGNVISLVIEQKDKDLAGCFEVGTTLDDVQFYSPIAMFNGTGVVSSKITIESGPRRGDFSIDIKVVSS